MTQRTFRFSFIDSSKKGLQIDKFEFKSCAKRFFFGPSFVLVSQMCKFMFKRFRFCLQQNEKKTEKSAVSALTRETKNGSVVPFNGWSFELNWMTIFLCIQIKNDNKKAEKTFLHANHSIEFMEIESSSIILGWQNFCLRTKSFKTNPDESN